MYTIRLTKEQMEGLAGLIDAGVRATGLRSVKIASQLSDILQASLDEGVIKVEKVEPIQNNGETPK